jgi:hypothetical protein
MNNSWDHRHQRCAGSLTEEAMPHAREEHSAATSSFDHGENPPLDNTDDDTFRAVTNPEQGSANVPVDDAVLEGVAVACGDILPPEPVVSEFMPMKKCYGGGYVDLSDLPDEAAAVDDTIYKEEEHRILVAQRHKERLARHISERVERKRQTREQDELFRKFRPFFRGLSSPPAVCTPDRVPSSIPTAYPLWESVPDVAPAPDNNHAEAFPVSKKRSLPPSCEESSKKRQMLTNAAKESPKKQSLSSNSVKASLPTKISQSSSVKAAMKKSPSNAAKAMPKETATTPCQGFRWKCFVAGCTHFSTLSRPDLPLPPLKRGSCGPVKDIDDTRPWRLPQSNKFILDRLSRMRVHLRDKHGLARDKMPLMLKGLAISPPENKSLSSAANASSAQKKPLSQSCGETSAKQSPQSNLAKASPRSNSLVNPVNASSPTTRSLLSSHAEASPPKETTPTCQRFRWKCFVAGCTHFTTLSRPDLPPPPLKRGTCGPVKDIDDSRPWRLPHSNSYILDRLSRMRVHLRDTHGLVRDKLPLMLKCHVIGSQEKKSLSGSVTVSPAESCKGSSSKNKSMSNPVNAAKEKSPSALEPKETTPMRQGFRWKCFVAGCTHVMTLPRPDLPPPPLKRGTCGPLKDIDDSRPWRIPCSNAYILTRLSRMRVHLRDKHGLARDKLPLMLNGLAIISPERKSLSGSATPSPAENRPLSQSCEECSPKKLFSNPAKVTPKIKSPSNPVKASSPTKASLPIPVKVTKKMSLSKPLKASPAKNASCQVFRWNCCVAGCTRSFTFSRPDLPTPPLKRGTSGPVKYVDDTRYWRTPHSDKDVLDRLSTMRVHLRDKHGLSQDELPLMLKPRIKARSKLLSNTAKELLAKKSLNSNLVKTMRKETSPCNFPKGLPKEKSLPGLAKASPKKKARPNYAKAFRSLASPVKSSKAKALSNPAKTSPNVGPSSREGFRWNCCVADCSHFSITSSRPDLPPPPLSRGTWGPVKIIDDTRPWRTPHPNKYLFDRLYRMRVHLRDKHGMSPAKFPVMLKLRSRH